jgi:hypothetical protein
MRPKVMKFQIEYNRKAWLREVQSILLVSTRTLPHCCLPSRASTRRNGSRYSPIHEEDPPEFWMGVQIGEDRHHSYHTFRSSTYLMGRSMGERKGVRIDNGKWSALREESGASRRLEVLQGYQHHLQILAVTTSPTWSRRGDAKGMKRGNQLNMPGECDCGAIEIITSCTMTWDRQNEWQVRTMLAVYIWLHPSQSAHFVQHTLKSPSETVHGAGSGDSEANAAVSAGVVHCRVRKMMQCR